MTALHWAAYLDQLPIAKALLNAGADPAPEPTASPRFRWPPSTAAHDRAAARQSADANTALPGGETALMTASPPAISPPSSCSCKRKRPTPKPRDARPDRAHVGRRRGHAEVVELLAEYGADIRQRASGFTSLFFAARQGHIPVVRALLDLGADVNAELQPTEPSRQAPRTGSTPLPSPSRTATTSSPPICSSAAAPGPRPRLHRAARDDRGAHRYRRQRPCASGSGSMDSLNSSAASPPPARTSIST
ncbi:MAG: ankyrin repeat domain-containing protein [Bryobacterales bacterium]